MKIAWHADGLVSISDDRGKELAYGQPVPDSADLLVWDLGSSNPKLTRTVGEIVDHLHGLEDES